MNNKPTHRDCLYCIPELNGREGRCHAKAKGVYVKLDSPACERWKPVKEGRHGGSYSSRDS